MNKLATYCQKIIDWGILIVLIATPLIFTTKVYAAFTLPKIAFFRSAVILLTVCWVMEMIATKKTPLLKMKLAWLLIAILFISLLATIFSIDPAVSFWGYDLRYEGFYSFACYIIFCLLVATHWRETKFWRTALDYLVYASLPICVYGLMQAIGWEVVTALNVDTQSRISSTLGNSLNLGAYLCFLVPLTLYRFCLQKKLKQKIYTALIIFLQVTVLILSLARSAYLGLIAGLIIFAILFGLSFRKKIYWISASSLSALLLIMVIITATVPAFANLMSGNTYTARFASAFTKQDASSLARLEVWETTLQMIADKPLLGYGFNTYLFAYNQYFPPKLQNYEGQEFDTSHNLFLDLSYSSGIINALLFLACLIYFGILAWHLIFKQDNQQKKLLAIAALSGVVGFIVQNQFNVPFSVTFIYLFFLVGLIESSTNPENPDEQIFNDAKPRWSTWLIGGSLIVLAGYLIIWTNIMPLNASGVYLKAKQQTDYKTQIELLKKARTKLGLSSDILIAENLFNAQFDYARALQQNKQIDLSLEQLKNAEQTGRDLIKRHPRHLYIYLNMANLYSFWGSNFDQTQFTLADEFYQKSQDLAPTKQLVYWIWGDSLMSREKFDEALVKYQTAIDLEPSGQASHDKLLQAQKYIEAKK